MPGKPNNNVPSNNQPVNVDVVFVHDATGSQQPYIDDARQFVNNNIRSIQNSAIMNGGDARYRVIAFRDHREQGDLWTVHDSNPFTKDSAVLKGQLDALVASGGGDGPEAQIDALDATLRSSWRRDAKRIVILITDSPPHGIREPGDVVPASHPGALTPDSIRQSFKTTKTLLTVVGCNPTISQYTTAVEWYTSFATETRGKYIPLPRTAGGSAVTSRALVGSVLHAVDSQRIADRWEDWIMDQSHRGHDAIVGDLHSKLAAEGEECHEVDCTEHGGHDVKYARGPVSRARVDNIVGTTLQRTIPFSLQGKWSGDLVYPSGPPGVGLTVSFEPFIIGKTTNGSGLDKNGEFSIQSAQFTYLSTADYVGMVTFLQIYSRWPGQLWYFVGTVRKDNNRIFGEWHDSPQDGRARTGKFNLEGVSQSVGLSAPMTLPSIALPSLEGEWSGDLVYPSGPPGVGLTVSFEPFIIGSTTNGRGFDKNGEFSIQSAQFTYLSTANYIGIVTFLQTYAQWPGQVWCFIGTVHKDNNRISGEWHDSPQDGRARTGKFSLERQDTAIHCTAMAPSRTQLAALWPNPGPSLTADTPALWPGSTPTSTAAARGYLQQDFERHHGFYNYRGFHNHTPFHILVEWALGGTEKHLEAIWNQHVALERPAHQAPAPITAQTFSNHLGDEEYYQGYLYFFSDLVLKKPVHAVVEEWIFSSKANFESYNGRQPEMLNRLLAGILHPMLYLGYGLEFSLPGLIAEGLAQAAVHKVGSSALLPKSMFDMSTTCRPGTHAFSIVSRIIRDRRFNNFVGSFDDVQSKHGDVIQRYAAEWTVDGTNPKEVAKKVRELSFLNVMIYAVGGWRDGEGFHNAEFTLMHLVTSSLTLTSYMAVLTSPMTKSLLLRAYFTRSLAYYISRGRPNLPVRSFFSSPILTDFPGPRPDPSESVYPEPTSPFALTPNIWLKIIQSALVHPDDHLSKVQRTLAHYGRLYGNIPPGEFKDTELGGSEFIDGTLFVRTAALTMEWMGRIREGEPARYWGDDPNYPESVIS